MFGKIGVVLALLALALAAPALTAADEAAILSRLDRLDAKVDGLAGDVRGVGARITALEGRMEARAQRMADPGAAAPVGIHDRVARHFEAVVDVKMSQALIASIDPPKPRGFFDSVLGTDSGGAGGGLLIFMLALKAIGGTVGIGF